MSEQGKAPKKCMGLSHPSLAPGWGCCNCRTYNGDQREACKVCQHKRCDKDPNNQVN